jgi:hypothetical protein
LCQKAVLAVFGIFFLVRKQVLRQRSSLLENRLKEKSLKGKKEEEEKKTVFLCHLEVFCNFVFGAEPSLLNSQVLCWKII